MTCHSLHGDVAFNQCYSTLKGNIHDTLIIHKDLRSVKRQDPDLWTAVQKARHEAADSTFQQVKYVATSCTRFP